MLYSFFIVLFCTFLSQIDCRLSTHQFTTVVDSSHTGPLMVNCSTKEQEQRHIKALLTDVDISNDAAATKPISHNKKRIKTLCIYGINVSMPQDIQINDKDTLKICFAWDLNSVIFEKNIKIRSMLNYARQKRGIIGTLTSSWTFLKLWRKKQQLKKQKKNEGYVWDAMFTNLAKQDPNMAAFLRTFAQQANVLDIHMITIMQELEQYGHTHAILSNMGQGLLDAQVEHLKKESNRYDSVLFDYTLRFLQDTKHNVVASQENGWMHKPNPDIYQLFLHKNQDKECDYSFFIDDKPENCIAAAQQGFIAFHYTNATPEKLKNAFNYMITFLKKNRSAFSDKTITS